MFLEECAIVQASGSLIFLEACAGDGRWAVLEGMIDDRAFWTYMNDMNDIPNCTCLVQSGSFRCVCICVKNIDTCKNYVCVCLSVCLPVCLHVCMHVCRHACMQV